MTLRSKLIAGVSACVLAAPLLTRQSRATVQDPDETVRIHLTAPSPDGAAAPEGHYLVSWDVGGPTPMRDSVRFQVQFGHDPTFALYETRNVGLDRATFLSGLPAGTTYVRVGPIADDGSMATWSSPHPIVVVYPGMSLVRGLMVLGTVTFILLAAIIWRGHQTNETLDPDEAAAR